MFDHEIGATRIADSITAHPDQVIKWIFESGLQQSFETGEVNRQEFCNRFSELSDTNLSPEFLLHSISDIFCLNRKLIPLIGQLKAVNFPIGILSNYLRFALGVCAVEIPYSQTVVLVILF